MGWHATVLKEITPSPEERHQLEKVAEQVMQAIKGKGITTKVGGSAAKDTWLRGNHDIDIYVQFDPQQYKGKDIAALLKKKVRGAKILHGSRDYLQKQVGTYTVELIPIFKVKNSAQAHNITDISPFHTAWVRKHKKYTDDIRLAKAFAKANGFYGAESYIQGFSGYALEVLTVHYKGFEQLIKNVAQWKERTSIDTLDLHKGKIALNKAKIHGPLIVVDPVQHTRNVTAVVSREKYNRFIKTAKEFLKHPHEQWFIKEEFDHKVLIKEKKGTLYVLTVVPSEGKHDVVGAKLLKAFEFLKRELQKYEFTIIDADWHWEGKEKATFWFDIKKEKVSKTVRHYGPPVTAKERVAHFRKKWKKRLYTEKGKVYVNRERTYKTPEVLLKKKRKDPYILKQIQQMGTVREVK